MEWINLIWWWSGGAMACLGIAIRADLGHERDGLDFDDLVLIIFWPVWVVLSIWRHL